MCIKHSDFLNIPCYNLAREVVKAVINLADKPKWKTFTSCFTCHRA